MMGSTYSAEQKQMKRVGRYEAVRSIESALLTNRLRALGEKFLYQR